MMYTSEIKSTNLHNNPYVLITSRIDTNIVHVLSEPRIQLKRIEEVTDDEMTQARSGVIVYTVVDGKIYFGMGMDTIHGSLTDFSGGVKYTDKNSVEAGLREFREESLGVFGNVTTDIIKDSIVIFSSSMMTIFIKVRINMNEACEQFNSRLDQEKCPEIKRIYWLTKTQFMSLVREKNADKIYYKVYNLILDAYNEYGDFISLL